MRSAIPPHEVVIAADGKRAFVANYGAQTPGSSISVIDLVGRKEIKRMKLESVPLGLVFLKDGKTAFVSVVQTDGVKVDAENFETLGRAETGNAPDGLAYYGN